MVKNLQQNHKKKGFTEKRFETLTYVCHDHRSSESPSEPPCLSRRCVVREAALLEAGWTAPALRLPVVSEAA